MIIIITGNPCERLGKKVTKEIWLIPRRNLAKMIPIGSDMIGGDTKEVDFSPTSAKLTSGGAGKVRSSATSAYLKIGVNKIYDLVTKGEMLTKCMRGIEMSIGISYFMKTKQVATMMIG